MTTYSAQMLPERSRYGEYHTAGVIMAQDGVATFMAIGSGGMTADGGSKLRGEVYFQNQLHLLWPLMANVWFMNGILTHKVMQHGIFGSGYDLNIF